MLIKIIGGYYKNLTYNLHSTYIFDKDKIKIKDILFVTSSSTDIEETLIRNHLTSNSGFKAIHVGLSRLDSFPLFKIDAKDIREDRIDQLLN